MKLTRIGSDAVFSQLASKGKPILSTAVWFDGLGDVCIPNGWVKFPYAKTLFVKQCNKNFVTLWITPNRFPLVKDLYLASHPCDGFIFRIWESERNNFYVHEDYKWYLRRYHGDDHSFKIISSEEYEAALGKFHQVEEIELDRLE